MSTPYLTVTLKPGQKLEEVNGVPNAGLNGYVFNKGVLRIEQSQTHNLDALQSTQIYFERTYDADCQIIHPGSKTKESAPVVQDKPVDKPAPRGRGKSAAVEPVVEDESEDETVVEDELTTPGE